MVPKIPTNMAKARKAIADAAVDPVSFKLPDWLDCMIRDKSITPKRSEFLRRCIGFAMVALTDKLVCGTDIAEMVMSEMIEPSDVVLLVKAESLSDEYVMGLINGSLITGTYARDIKIGLQDLRDSDKSTQDRGYAKRKAHKTSSQRRLV